MAKRFWKGHHAYRPNDYSNYVGKPLFEADRDLVLASAFAAHRINDGYFKDSVWVEEGSTDNRTANRDLVMKFIKDDSNITQEDRDNVEAFKEWCLSFSHKILDDSISDFMRKIVGLAYGDTEWTSQNIGIAACSPRSYFQGLEQNKREEILSSGENHFGQIGDKFKDLIVTVISSRMVTSKETGERFSICDMMTENNEILVCYRDYPKDSKLKINGRVKAHREHETFGKSTVVNYVKVVEWIEKP